MPNIENSRFEPHCQVLKIQDLTINFMPNIENSRYDLGIKQ